MILKRYMNLLQIIKILFILLLALNLKAQQNNSCWSNFRGDNKLTGVATVVIPDKFSLLWSYKTGSDVKSSPVVCDNSIFVGSTDGNIYALTTAGKLLWKYHTVAGVEAPPLYSNGIVVVGAMDGIVYALNGKTGKLIWKYKTEGQVSGSANIVTVKNKTCVLIPSYEDRKSVV